jgi:FtsZ-binding cell division protein ZapB
MQEFIKCINLPTEVKNITSRLNSINKTHNLITDFEELKYEYEMLTQNYNILKSQNEMLIKENENLQFNSKIYSEEVDSLKLKLKVIRYNLEYTRNSIISN